MVNKQAPVAAPKQLTTAEILVAVAQGKIKAEEAAKLIDAQPKVAGRLYCKVSEKGAVSVYGLQRMPVTLYAQQFARLIEYAPEITAFIEANKATLSYK